jgi:hypothetical protein
MVCSQVCASFGEEVIVAADVGVSGVLQARLDPPEGGLPQLQASPEVGKEDGNGERSACRQGQLRGAGVIVVVARFGSHVPAMLGVATWKLLIPSPVAWPALVSLFQP